MWCTRWFLPLLLLPLPTAPPYFLILFLFSLTMHAKPCFYCIVLLTTLFISSCYWQPFPLDTPLTVPWSDNVTNFAQALNSTLMPNYTHPLPTVIRAADRCWCDFSSDGFFEPFNVSHWEYVSVVRLKGDLERKRTIQETTGTLSHSRNATPPLASNVEMPQTTAPSSTSVASPTTSTKFWPFLRFSQLRAIKSFFKKHPAQVVVTDSQPAPNTQTSNLAPKTNLPKFRKEYDLRPCGLGLIIDFGWTR